MRNAGIGAGLIVENAFVIWMGTGISTVQEGQRQITQFGASLWGRYQLAGCPIRSSA